jgi:cardiolipin synthase
MRPSISLILLIVSGFLFLQPVMADGDPPATSSTLVHKVVPGPVDHVADIPEISSFPSDDPFNENSSVDKGGRSKVPAPLLMRQVERNHNADGFMHLVGSHLSAVVRPVSTVFRLFSIVAYTGLDALRSTPSDDIPSGPPPRVVHGPGMDLEAWEIELDAITHSSSTLGTMELLIDGDEFFPRLERAVAGASKSIHLQTYIFDNDDYALDFGRLLRDRSSDVDVRVLMDGLGSIMAGGVDHESLPVSHTHPSSLVRFLKEESGVKVRRLPNPWLTFDHTKSIVIDRRTAFVGGMNIGREYRHVWHDLMVQVQGPVVAILQDEFSKTWKYAGLVGDLALLTSHKRPVSTLPESDLYPVRVLKTRIGRSQIYKAQIAAIRRAKSYIYIENPYLSDDVVLHELIKARYRGVDVRVVIPLECNWKAMSRSNVLAANEMLANRIRVYLYPGMSHVKAAIFDGWVCLGSANLDKASLRFNREINLATSHPPVAEEIIMRLFKKDFDESILLTESYRERKSDRMYEMMADLM